jgi:hypothetical protein
MTITQNNYLDPANLIINELFGDVGLFIVVGLAVMTWYGVKNHLPYEVILVCDFLFVGLVTAYYYTPIAWIVSLFVLGIIIYFALPKIVNG